MSYRRKLAAVAASAFMAYGGVALADQPASVSPYSVSPFALDDQPAPAYQTPALTDALGRTPVGKSMASWGISITGYVEGSYTDNLNAHDHGDAFNGANPESGDNVGRVFDSAANVERLNQAELLIQRQLNFDQLKAGKWDFGGLVEMVYGSDAGYFHAASLGTYGEVPTKPLNQFDLEQAYALIGVPVGTGIQLTVGKFDTILGYEVTQPTGNAFYSHSILYNYSYPVTQTGVMALYHLSDKVSVQGGFTMGWGKPTDVATNDPNGDIDFLGGVTFTPSSTLTAILNVSVGPEQSGATGLDSNYRYLLNGVVTWKPGQWTFALDSCLAMEDNAANTTNKNKTEYWGGIAIWAGYAINDFVTPNARVEWFHDDGGSRIGVTASAYEATVGVTIKPLAHTEFLSGLEVRPEARIDWSNLSIYHNRPNQETIALDVIYAF